MSRQEYYELLASHYKGEALLLGCKASVHLENKDDERFWDTMMQYNCPGKYNYIYSSRNERGVDTSGCIQCLQFKGHLSADFFICIDSDYRLLRQEPDLDDNGTPVIERLKTTLNHVINPIKTASLFNLEAEKAHYNSLGLNKENAYLHYRGHNLYNLVLSIGKNLCNGRLDFEKDVLLHGLSLDAYPEISLCKADLERLHSMLGAN